MAKTYLTILAKNPIVDSDWVLDRILYYLLAKVHRMSTKRSTKSFFSLKLTDNWKIVARNRSIIQRDILNNRATQVK